MDQSKCIYGLFNDCFPLIKDISPDDPIKTKNLRFQQWIENDIDDMHKQLGVRKLDYIQYLIHEMHLKRFLKTAKDQQLENEAAIDQLEQKMNVKENNEMEESTSDDDAQIVTGWVEKESTSDDDAPIVHGMDVKENNETEETTSSSDDDARIVPIESDHYSDYSAETSRYTQSAYSDTPYDSTENDSDDSDDSDD